MKIFLIFDRFRKIDTINRIRHQFLCQALARPFPSTWRKGPSDVPIESGPEKSIRYWLAVIDYYFIKFDKLKLLCYYNKCDIQGQNSLPLRISIMTWIFYCKFLWRLVFINVNKNTVHDNFLNYMYMFYMYSICLLAANWIWQQNRI